MTEDFKKTMDALLENEVIDRHTFFQLKHFVVGKEPTTQSKMWRCLRELKARRDSINSLGLEIEETEDKIKLEEITLENLQKTQSSPEILIKSRQINRRLSSYKISLVELKTKLKFVEEEADFFIKAFQSLNKIERLLPADDIVAQTEYWNEKLGQEMQMRILLQQPIDLELVKTIMSLNDAVPVKAATSKMLDRTKHQLEEINTKKLEG